MENRKLHIQNYIINKNFKFEKEEKYYSVIIWVYPGDLVYGIKIIRKWNE